MTGYDVSRDVDSFVKEVKEKGNRPSRRSPGPNKGKTGGGSPNAPPVEEDEGKESPKELAPILKNLAKTALLLYALNKILEVMKKNSVILNTVLGAISKALGLLLDFVLLPFLPILTKGIIELYKSIVSFGKWWGDNIKPLLDILEKQGILGLLKLGLEAGATTMEGWIKGLLVFLFGSEKEKQPAGLSVVVSLMGVLQGIFAVIDRWILTPLLQFIFGENAPSSKELALNIVASLKDFLEGLAKPILDFLFGKATVKDKAVGLVVGITKGLNPTAWLWHVAEYLFTKNNSLVLKTLSVTINLVKGVGGWLWNVLSDAYNAAVSTVSSVGNVLSGVSGNNSVSTSSTTTVNFSGYNEDQMVSKVKNILRQSGSGYSI